MATVWVPVQDMSRAVGFYRDALGLTIKSESEQWSEIDANGLMIGLNAREKTASSGSAGGAVISFQPDSDLESEVEQMKGKGVTFTGEVSEHPWGRIAPFQDTEGNDLQLYAPPK